MYDHNYYVYILTNANYTVLYVGVANDLCRRVAEQKARMQAGFTQKYNVNKLVCFEHYQDVNDAIAREKQLKAGSRLKRPDLINTQNEAWHDLFDTL